MKEFDGQKEFEEWISVGMHVESAREAWIASRQFLSNRAIEALKILASCNPLRHDFDAFLLDVAWWGLKGGKKPVPKDFGLPPIKENNVPN